MKHVPRLGAEPPLLTDYRAANPADVAASGREARGVWSRFRDAEAYGELRNQLVMHQQGLCGYCEQRVTHEASQLVANDQQIEHVAAKSGGSCRALDWRNFMLCCGGGTYREKEPQYHDPVRHYSGDSGVSCGQWKGDKELLPGCDPRDFPCGPRLVDVGLDGTVSAREQACLRVGIDPESLNRTLNEILNLNCERLKSARRKVADEIRELVVWLAEQLLQKMHLGQARRDDFGAIVAEGRLSPDAHGHLRAFWTTERQYLEPWSTAWIARNWQVLGSAAPPDPQVTP